MWVQTYTFLKSNKKKTNKQIEMMYFEMLAKRFFVELKAQWSEGGRRILLGYNTRDRAVMLLPIRFSCVQVWISIAVDQMCKFHLAQNMISAGLHRR